MKLACVDKTASDRLKLQGHFNSAFESCRDAIGHMAAVDFIPLSKEEALLTSLVPSKSKDHRNSSAFEGLIIGPGYSIDELISVSSNFRGVYAALPIFALIVPENFSLRTLRRLEKLSVEVFVTDDSAARLVHSVFRAGSRPSNQPDGKLISLVSGKGGVGVSTIAGGLAHAAKALGHSAIIIDLSEQGALFHYLQCDKWQSTDYRTAIIDRINIASTQIQKLIVEAPNGIKLLLPPAGASDVREMWLRNPQSVETTLILIDALREQFDLVLVDFGHAEGLLPFSILAKSDVRLVVTSNEPASVHLTQEKLIELDNLPSQARTIIFVNLLLDYSLIASDIEDFLSTQKSFKSFEITSMQKDLKGAGWIGTGNTIYTEGSFIIQEQLKELVNCLGGEKTIMPQIAKTRRSKNKIRDLIWKRKKKSEEIRYPALESHIGDQTFSTPDSYWATTNFVSRFSTDNKSADFKFTDEFRPNEILRKRAVGE
jgi:cellulose biosynthesis protein BcsQ